MNRYVQSIGSLFLLGAQVVTQGIAHDDNHASEVRAIRLDSACDASHTHVEKIRWHINMPHGVPDLEANGERTEDTLGVVIKVGKEYAPFSAKQRFEVKNAVEPEIFADAVKAEHKCGGVAKGGDSFIMTVNFIWPKPPSQQTPPRQRLMHPKN